MNLRVRENPWRLMLAVNAAVVIGVFLYKITLPPYVPYIHLLVDYHFGFTKRALIGAIVSLFFAKVPVWLVFALAGGVWLVTFGLFIELFRRTFGLDRADAAVGIHGRLAVLSEEFHAYARAFRYLRLRARDMPLAGAGAVRRVRDRGGARVDDPRADPPHSSLDVCADHRRHRGAALLSRGGFRPAKPADRNGRRRGRRPLVPRRAILRVHDGLARRLRRLSQGSHGRPHPNRSFELQLHLVPAAGSGNPRDLGSHAVEPARHSLVCVVDLAARPALEIPCRFDPRAGPRISSPRRRCLAGRGECCLSDHLCDRVRLFAMDLELGGLHVPDPACGKNLARLARRAADIRG